MVRNYGLEELVGKRCAVCGTVFEIANSSVGYQCIDPKGSPMIITKPGDAEKYFALHANCYTTAANTHMQTYSIFKLLYLTLQESYDKINSKGGFHRFKEKIKKATKRQSSK